MTTVACRPDPADLADHARDALGREEAASLDRHLTGCTTCLERYLGHHRRSLVPDIPNCHVVKEIGRGRFGVVYKAWQIRIITVQQEGKDFKKNGRGLSLVPESTESPALVILLISFYFVLH